MRGTFNLAKKILSYHNLRWYKFTLFLYGSRQSNFRQKINFPKIASNYGETLLLMRGTCRLAKNFFLSTIQDSTKFHYFCKGRACRISVKKSIFQKLLKIVKKQFF